MKPETNMSPWKAARARLTLPVLMVCILGGIATGALMAIGMLLGIPHPYVSAIPLVLGMPITSIVGIQVQNRRRLRIALKL